MSKTAGKPADPIAPITSGQFVTCKEAAGILKLSEISVRRFLTRKKLRRYKVGSRTLIKVSELAGLVHEAK